MIAITQILLSDFVYCIHGNGNGKFKCFGSLSCWHGTRYIPSSYYICICLLNYMARNQFLCRDIQPEIFIQHSLNVHICSQQLAHLSSLFCHHHVPKPVTMQHHHAKLGMLSQEL